jgi:arginyl-tRNA synthetase
MNEFKKQIAEVIAEQLKDLTINEVFEMIETPPESHMGDYGFPCFRLAKLMRKSPQVIASELAAGIVRPPIFSKVINEGGYVNFYFDRKALSENIIQQVLTQKEKFGSSSEGENKVICIDYSCPNIAKPFHVGHLRSTVIGNALYHIYEHMGYQCVGINHLGDWGTQFGKVIVAYRNWGSAAEVEAEPIQTLLNLYVKFHEEAEKDPSLEDEARNWFTRMEQGDQEAMDLWRWFSSETLKELEKIYALLGVKFDHYTGESFYNDKMAPVLADLKEKNLLKESQGAVLVDLEPYGMPPCLVQKNDGSTLYATRDITAALYRKQTFDFYQCLYLTDYSQKLHFEQVFKVVELMGHNWAKDLIHLPFGRVTHEGRRIQSRKGTVVLLEDVLKGAIGRVAEIIEEKNPLLENKEETAVAVGVGAVIFNDLSNNRIKDISFSWDTAFSFEGETGPYVQYTYARACSVLRKAGDEPLDPSVLNGTCFEDDVSAMVVRKLEQFGDAVRDAQMKNEPSILTRHVIDLAQAFNRFYHDHPVLIAEPEVRQARLLLVAAVRQALGVGLNLLGIQTPEKM